jgi:hypothetical protein
MRQKDAVRTFKEMDLQKRRVFISRDFRKMFPGDSDKALADSIQQMVIDEVLERPTRGVYVFADSRQPRGNLLYEVARTLRRGSYAYLSLESALSEYGAISQIPVGHHTFMTTGRRGEFKTSYGTIEFNHTSRNPSDFVADLIDNGRPLPIASLERAVIDFRRVGRSTQMIKEEDLLELLEEKAELMKEETCDASVC